MDQTFHICLPSGPRGLALKKVLSGSQLLHWNRSEWKKVFLTCDLRVHSSKLDLIHQWKVCLWSSSPEISSKTSAADPVFFLQRHYCWRRNLDQSSCNNRIISPNLCSWHMRQNSCHPLPTTVQDTKISWSVHHDGVVIKGCVLGAV